MNDRPKSIPEMRGMALRAVAGDGWSGATRDPERPYSAASYAAQYGITIESAEDLRVRYTRHTDIEHAIYRMFAADHELRDAALLLDEAVVTDEVREEAVKFLRKLGMKPPA